MKNEPVPVKEPSLALILEKLDEVLENQKKILKRVKKVKNRVRGLSGAIGTMGKSR